MSETSIKNKQESIKNNLLEAKKNAHSAIETGKVTLETLEQQNEMIQEVEDTLEANEFIVHRSLRALRGMTWSGYVANKCSDLRNIVVVDSAPQRASISKTKDGNISSALSGKLFNEEKDKTTSTVAADQDIDEISSAVDTLHRMGVAMGEHLEGQSATLDRIEEKTTRVTDQTLAITLRASQLLRKNNRPIQSFVGTFQFIDSLSGRYLSVAADGSSIAFRARADLSSYFHVFVKENHLFGLLNEKTQRYLGCTVWGTVAVLGQYFGTQEECYLDLSAFMPAAQQPSSNKTPISSANSTGILFLARHWGAGGWLRLIRTADMAALDEWVTAETTSDLSDKAGAVVMSAVRAKVDPSLEGDKSADSVR